METGKASIVWRLYFLPIAALRNRVKSGWGERGRARNSGWNWVRRKNGCLESGSSAISISLPSGEIPENIRPLFSISGINSGFTS